MMPSGVAGRIVVGKHTWVLIEVLLMQLLLYNPAVLTSHHAAYYSGEPLHSLGAGIAGRMNAHTHVVLDGEVYCVAI